MSELRDRPSPAEEEVKRVAAETMERERERIARDLRLHAARWTQYPHTRNVGELMAEAAAALRALPVQEGERLEKVAAVLEREHDISHLHARVLAGDILAALRTNPPTERKDPPKAMQSWLP